MPQTQSLDERLAEARREAQGWREKLSDAEQKLNAAVAEKRYADADQHKAAADAAREPLLIAEAHCQALTAGVQALEGHRQAENVARQERERRELATANYDKYKAAEADAQDEFEHLKAELKAAYGALRSIMSAAVEAERQVALNRIHAWENGTVGGQMDPGYPRPPVIRNFEAKLTADPVLSVIWRTPQLP